MEYYVLNLAITECDGCSCLIEVTRDRETAYIHYTHGARKIVFLNENSTSSILRQNELQFRKILHGRPVSLFVRGASLTFVLTDKKDVQLFNDKSRIISIDRRNGRNRIESLRLSEHHDPGRCILYTDGCSMPFAGNGAAVALVIRPDGTVSTRSERTEFPNNNLMELLSVILGLEDIPGVDNVRIITDSQYVRKGLAEWIVNWRLNGWTTASGRRAKHVDYWKRCDSLTENRYLELQWIRGGSDDRYHRYCDNYARALASGADVDDFPLP